MMIKLAQEKQQIDQPITQVFSYVTNMENYRNWFPGIDSIKAINNLEHGQVGKQYVETLSLPQGTVDLIIEVKEMEQNRLFMTQGDLEPLLPQMTINFSETSESSCIIELTYFSRNLELRADDELIIGLANDLSIRANEAVKELKRIMEC
ncbi:hypothetical protein [Photobacterium sp. OFAV2-7]|uniref:SRPBCC family protein n=1 Tax=Photobacterium sp. OFAV2-7 TaxID=2917748 RepID=UPI001EF64686|nr:hypothetical protein [Photobacterium sp. OFAV2-7]MCG7585723.1 hypothetical protein [Photobacterium sp. OFAV2-7]